MTFDWLHKPSTDKPVNKKARNAPIQECVITNCDLTDSSPTKGLRTMQRIAVIGSPGAGKSTFARQLASITGIELFHLDNLYWKPGWLATPKTEWVDLQKRLVTKSSWIIDGNYGSTMDIRIRRADTVIFLDLPRRVCLWRGLKRAIQYRGQTRPDMGEGCTEKIDLEFFQYIWGFRKREQSNILICLAKARQAGKQVIRFNSKYQVQGFLSSLLAGQG